MRIRIPTFHPDADPDPNPDSSFQNKDSNPWKSAKIGSYSIHFGWSSAKDADLDPVPDPAYHSDADLDFGFLFDSDAGGCGFRLPKWRRSTRITTFFLRQDVSTGNITKIVILKRKC
jgi:hypothetical protein